MNEHCLLIVEGTSYLSHHLEHVLNQINGDESVFDRSAVERVSCAEGF